MLGKTNITREKEESMQIQWQDQARELQLCSTRSPAVSLEGRPDKVPCARAEAMQPVNGHTQTCLFSEQTFQEQSNRFAEHITEGTAQQPDGTPGTVTFQVSSALNVLS